MTKWRHACRDNLSVSGSVGRPGKSKGFTPKEGIKGEGYMNVVREDKMTADH